MRLVLPLRNTLASRGGSGFVPSGMSYTYRTCINSMSYNSLSCTGLTSKWPLAERRIRSTKEISKELRLTPREREVNCIIRHFIKEETSVCRIDSSVRSACQVPLPLLPLFLSSLESEFTLVPVCVFGVIFVSNELLPRLRLHAKFRGLAQGTADFGIRRWLGNV